MEVVGSKVAINAEKANNSPEWIIVSKADEAKCISLDKESMDIPDIPYVDGMPRKVTVHPLKLVLSHGGPAKGQRCKCGETFCLARHVPLPWVVVRIATDTQVGYKTMSIRKK